MVAKKTTSKKGPKKTAQDDINTHPCVTNKKGKAKKKTSSKKVVSKKTTTRKVENNQPAAKKKKATRKTDGCAKNGGARKGAGRKKGAATKRTREIADKLAESAQITPLEYMLQTLNTTPDSILQDYKDGKIDIEICVSRLESLTQRRDDAAKNAAPYIHPRLSSVTATVTDPAHEAYVKEREALKKQLMAGEEPA